MIVWVFQLGYRPDYEVRGVYATKELADAAKVEYDEQLGDSRLNPSWESTVFGMPVQGLIARETEGKP
jgi:hypothetical protein